MPESMFKGLRTTIYRVADMQEAVEWYAGLLGQPPYFNEPFYAGFNVGGFELGLQPYEEEVQQAKSRNVASYWSVDDIEDTFSQMQKHGAKAYEKPQDVGGGIKTATLLDPWGNLIGIIQEPPVVEASQRQDPGVTALGGIFFKSKDPDALKKWYEEMLGLSSGPYGTSFRWRKPGKGYGYTVWSVFSQKSDYFGAAEQSHMVNYRVKDLDGLLERLRAHGVDIPKEPESFDYGKFAWVTDPDGNRIELWEPDDGVYGKMGDEWAESH
ncbi:VOC family protein [Roseivirga sp. BDSF3-8]|uniref:VOC family protein n=1 Tax=Roseivirga sp. BDSF3-8 TaxID=3241598 RepID=UPI003531BE44